MKSPYDWSSPILQMSSSGSQILVDAPLHTSTIDANDVTTEEHNDISNTRWRNEGEESFRFQKKKRAKTSAIWNELK